MIFEKLFTQSGILESAMQATQYKNKVIMENITNADTPNYKRKEVQFEGALAEAIQKTKETGESHMGQVMSNISVYTNPNSTTHDRNGVDIETEMIALYKNSTKYDVIVNSVLSNSKIKSTIYSTFN